MSNGKALDDAGFVPQDMHAVPMSNFKIRLKRVKQVLKAIDPSKSANGVPPIFWKETANVVAPALAKLLQFIVQSEIPKEVESAKNHPGTQARCRQ